MSWGATINHSLLRKSHSTSDLDKDDASYLRLSLGEFFAQRSEALGCLGGGNNVKRVSMESAGSTHSHQISDFEYYDGRVTLKWR